MKNNVSFNSELSKFGIGLFETIKIENGNPIDLNLHLNRIFKSIETLNLDIKETKSFIEERIIEYIKCEKIDNKALRLTMFDEGYNISTRDILYKEQTYKRGFKLNVSPIRRGDSILHRHKTTNYFENIYTKKFAVKNGYDDAIFIDCYDRILECSMSNIFFIKDEKIYTPNEKLPILEGTMKRRIMEVCVELGINIEQSDIKITDIDKFDFCFLSNSLMGIMKVRQINEIEFKCVNKTFDKLWSKIND
ncbi:aminotransferase class IV [Paraclostridium ghonii]|uniref:4-amino-4-deoxychorismate lyase n=1 Tax=Paraclostridium ghonii TaxID=29358 RepID=A0ABU0MYS3_9FIRM|nr:aminotransferase class IV [Paeniclostridium ghonii]MDQ0556067.1 4-amino-4-deoxychorismate lyase [Paeniclostridium ghonii]